METEKVKLNEGVYIGPGNSKCGSEYTKYNGKYFPLRKIELQGVPFKSSGCFMDCINPSSYRPYKYTHTIADIIEDELHPKGGHYSTYGILTTDNPAENPCRKQYLSAVNSKPVNDKISAALEELFTIDMIRQPIWGQIEQRWLNSGARKKFREKMLLQNAHVLHPVEKTPIFLSREFVFDFNDLVGSDISTLPEQTRVLILKEVMKQYYNLGEYQKSIATAFVNNPANKQLFSKHIEEFCALNLQSDWCACTKEAVTRMFGNPPKEVLDNPACFYPKCAQKGFMTETQIRAARNCPEINVCNVNIDIDNIQDPKLVAGIRQQCQSAATVQKQQTNVDNSRENIFYALLKYIRNVFG